VRSSATTSSLPMLVLALAVALLVAASTALAATESQQKYAEEVEPICKANSEANSRILKGVKTQVQKDELLPAGKRFIRASDALGKAVIQIAAVPRPEEYAAKLEKWIGYLKSEKTYLRKIGKALKSKDKFEAQKLAVDLNKNNNKANSTVISFPFKECRIDSSRFI
jgi:serine protease inhibitor ecotin